ncbi:MAG: hypothetical protein VCC00_12670 [Deltaproteobacteria bacterium]
MVIIRTIASVAILVWGLLTLLIGVSAMNPSWIGIGAILSIVGLPFLAGLPMAAKYLYPSAER